MYSNKFSINKKQIRKITNKKFVIISALCFILLITIVLSVKNIIEQNNFHYETVFDVSHYIENLDESWWTDSRNPSISEAKIETGKGFIGYSLVIYFHKTGTNIITISNGIQNLKFEVTIDGNHRIKAHQL